MKEYLGCVADDWRSNRGFYVEFVWLFTFRSASYLRNSKFLCVRVIGLPFRVIQRIVSLIVFSIDIPTRTVIGSGLCVRHGFGLVVHADAILGRGVLLRHGVTIGATERGVPVIKDDVDIGASAIILGDVVIGEGAVVGAGAVVVCDVPPMAVVVGNPARVVSAG